MNGPLPELPLPWERRALRLSMGVTVAEAAAELRVSVRTYLRWEHGHSVPRPAGRRAYAAQLERWSQA